MGSEHVFDLGRADAVRQRAERAVRRGMRIAAHHRHTRQGRALLRADHVHDTLTLVVHAEFDDVEVGAVLVECLDLQPRYRVFDALAAIGGRDVMVGGRQVGRGAPQRTTGQTQPLKRLRRGHLVHQVPVDVQQRRTVGLFADHMRFPQLVVERFRFHGDIPLTDGNNDSG